MVPKGGVLWHCSEGKDRAGWGAAFVLAALGASRDVIVQDFNISNEAYAAQVQALTSMVPQVEGAEGAIVGVNRENFEATLDPSTKTTVPWRNIWRNSSDSPQLSSSSGTST